VVVVAEIAGLAETTAGGNARRSRQGDDRVRAASSAQTL